MLCARDHDCPSGPGGVCCGDPHTEAVAGVSVASITLTCGMCEAGIEIEDDDLDSESGKVAAWAMFGECSECGAMYDASLITFQADKKEGSAND